MRWGCGCSRLQPRLPCPVPALRLGCGRAAAATTWRPSLAGGRPAQDADGAFQPSRHAARRPRKRAPWTTWAAPPQWPPTGKCTATGAGMCKPGHRCGPAVGKGVPARGYVAPGGCWGRPGELRTRGLMEGWRARPPRSVRGAGDVGRRRRDRLGGYHGPCGAGSRSPGSLSTRRCPREVIAPRGRHGWAAPSTWVALSQPGALSAVGWRLVGGRVADGPSDRRMVRRAAASTSQLQADRGSVSARSWPAAQPGSPERGAAGCSPVTRGIGSPASQCRIRSVAPRQRSRRSRRSASRYAA